MISTISRLAIFVSVFLAYAHGGFAAQLVVIESTVASLPPGQVIDSATKLELAAGGRLTLVGEDGTVTKLQGPYSGRPAAAAGSTAEPAMVQALSRLFVSNQPTTATWGTFRDAETARGGGDNPPQIWAVNVRRSETTCVPADQQPVLWRPDPALDLSVVVLHLSTGSEATIDFAAGEDRVAWPSGVPLLDGGEYAIRETGNLWERRLTVKVIPAEQASGIAQAAWMADIGCFRQARALLAQVQ